MIHDCLPDFSVFFLAIAESREFAKILRSLEQFIQIVKERSEQCLVTEYIFKLFLKVSHMYAFKLEKIVGI